MGRNAMSCQATHHRINQLGLFKLQRGEVHCHRPLGMPFEMPYTELAAGLIDHPVANRNNQPALFRQRQELVR